MKAKLIKTIDGYKLLTQGFLKGSTNHELIDSLNVEEGSIRYKLSLKNCQVIENGYDLDELVEQEVKLHNTLSPKAFKRGVQIGFQKALELIGDKIFTLEDMMNCWNKALTFQTHKETLGEHIQSLQQTEWDVIVETKKVIDETKIVGSVKGVKGSGNKINTYKSVPKLDVDGQLILKRVV